jgi:Protein of unknown function (DUF2924)
MDTQWEVSMVRSISSKRSRNWLASRNKLGELAPDIEGLLALDASALRRQWTALFGSEPSPSFGRALLIRAIAYRLQEKAFGGLKPATQRLLDRAADHRSKNEPIDIPEPRASAGAVLIREWGGVSHRVTVLDNEVVYQGRRYKSLSEVARAITGSRWSGPLFFGLKGRARVAVNG